MKITTKITRWSIASAVLIALFWMTCHLIKGNVPSNIGVSRWWDILIGPIWSIAVILLLKVEKVEREEVRNLLICMIPALIVGLIFSLWLGLSPDPTWSLILGLLFGILFGLPYGLVACMVFALIFGLPLGIAFGSAFTILEIVKKSISSYTKVLG
jgi:hypothetical protein